MKSYGKYKAYYISQHFEKNYYQDIKVRLFYNNGKLKL